MSIYKTNAANSKPLLDKGQIEGEKSENYSAGFSSLVFFLRGWGEVPSILRKTSSGSGSLSFRLRGFFSVIGKPSENQENDESIRLKTKLLLEKTTKVYYANLDHHEYGMPYADETILKTILRHLVKFDLTTSEKIMKVLQFLPQNPEYLEE